MAVLLILIPLALGFLMFDGGSDDDSTEMTYPDSSEDEPVVRVGGASADAIVGTNEGEIIDGLGGADTFFLNSERVGDFAIIEDYNPGEDQISVIYDAEGAVPTVSINEGFARTKIFLDGELYAIAPNTTGLIQASDISLVAV